MTVDAAIGSQEAERKRAKLGVFDCDVHNSMPSRETLKQYLPKKLHGYYDHIKGRAVVQLGARPQPDFFRRDAFPSGGGPPGSDLDLLREQYLDPHNVRGAVLSPLDMLGWPTHGEVAHAMNSGLNDFVTEHWLERDDRLYGAICVPLEDGVRAAAEIDRVAANPRFVMVLLLITTREPLGDPKYWPIYEAAARHGLPVGVHVAGFSGAGSSSGWPVYFIESRADLVFPYSVQVASLVYSGVFDQFPDLQFVLEEGGIGWAPPLMWRLDRAWDAMREDHPHLSRRPSEVVREHFWFTTQPLDDPETPEYLGQLLDQLDMDGRVLFASDYPHWDFDDPTRVLPASVIGRERRERIIAANALDVMRFPAGV
jgi:predicted TIM-barrel fold metal-dependent hydrolase